MDNQQQENKQDVFKCKEDQHMKQQYQTVCTKPYCIEKTRFGCLECCLSSNHFSQDKQFLKSIINIQNSKDSHFSYWDQIDKQILEIYQKTQQQQNNDDVQKMENSLNNLKIQINQQIDKLIKALKVTISQNNQQNQQTFADILLRIKKNYDITSLQQIISNFQKGEIQENVANQQVSDFFKISNSKQEENNIINEFNNQPIIKFKEEIITNEVQPKIIQQIVELEQTLLSNNQLLWKELQFYQGLASGSDNRLIFDKASMTMKTLNNCEFYSTVFNKKQKVNFSFKVLEDAQPKNNCFIFGIHAQKQDKKYGQWGATGNQFCLIYNNSNQIHSKDKFEVKGKFPHEIYQVGIQYDIQICVEQNLMTISDSEKKTEIINQKKFEQEQENWVLCFYSDHANRKIQIIKAEIN